MPKRQQPDGGRYTRPRRGFRAISNYKARLKKRGLSPKDVRMDSLDALRRKQGNVSGSANGIGRKGHSYKTLRDTNASVQMSGRMSEMASDNTMEIWSANPEMESDRQRSTVG